MKRDVQRNELLSVLSDFVKISQVSYCSMRYGDLSLFQNGSRPPSWICSTHFTAIHKEYLMVFIVEQNLKRIDAVV